MRFFRRLLTSIALSAFLALLLFAAAMLVFQPPLPAWLPELARSERIALLVACPLLLFLLVFSALGIKPRNPSSSPRKNCPARPEHVGLNAKNAGAKGSELPRAASVERSSGEEPCSADFIAKTVSRTVKQAIVSFLPEAQAYRSNSHSGRYIYCASEGFEGIIPSPSGDPSKKERLLHDRHAEALSGFPDNPRRRSGLDSITSRDGIFVIDSEAASMPGDCDLDSDFQNLVNSVLT